MHLTASGLIPGGSRSPTRGYHHLSIRSVHSTLHLLGVTLSGVHVGCLAHMRSSTSAPNNGITQLERRHVSATFTSQFTSSAIRLVPTCTIPTSNNNSVDRVYQFHHRRSSPDRNRTCIPRGPLQTSLRHKTPPQRLICHLFHIQAQIKHPGQPKESCPDSRMFHLVANTSVKHWLDVTFRHPHYGSLTWPLESTVFTPLQPVDVIKDESL